VQSDRSTQEPVDQFPVVMVMEVVIVVLPPGASIVEQTP